MAITDINSALAQYNANLSWQGDLASAQAALAAIRYLLVNRAQQIGDSNTTINYASLETEKKALETFLGATGPRSFGRTRRVTARFGEGGVE